MWVAYYKDQTMFGPFYSIKSAHEKMLEMFGANYRNFIKIWAVEDVD